ncbi:MAG: hypothetical protein QME58_10520, partial [Bacteroidota bacterium]|nr:hypothetical protein [Bacteroidota bacterium]
MGSKLVELNSSKTAFRSGLENDKTEVKIFLVQTAGERFSKSEQRVGVSFRYNEGYINELKKIPGHRWHTDLKQWSFSYSAENIKQIIKIFGENKINISPELQLRLNIKEQQ